MKYQVTVYNGGNIRVTVPTTTIKRLVDTNIATNMSGNISDLNDIDLSNRQNNYVLIWNQQTQKHEYVSPFEIIDRGDGVDDDAIDYGVY